MKVRGESYNLSLTISTALVLIGEMGAPTGIDGAEAQLSDAIPQEKDEGSTSWHVEFGLLSLLLPRAG